MDFKNRVLKLLIISGLIFCSIYLTISLVRVLLPKNYLLNKSGFSQAVYSYDKKLLELSLSTDEKYRLFSPLKNISKDFINSILAQEDQYFYSHPGINPFAVIRGAWLTYGRNQRTGGSTITMQLARIRFGITSRNILGKIKQLLTAGSLELLYTKDEILEAYLNLIPFGGNIEGIPAASLIYLKKDARDLNQAESILLAVIPESPFARNPNKETEKLYQAANTLLKRINSKLNINELKQVKLFGNKHELPKIAPHFSNRLMENFQFESQIYSSLDLKFQLAMENQIKSFIQKNRNIGIQNASSILVDCSTMKVRAYIGSSDFWDKKIQGQVDGLTAQRSPGSVLKPFLYAMGIDQGLIHPGTMMKDVRFSRSAYEPENFEKDFVGPISATDALVRSRNLPAVMLLNKIGSNTYLNFLRDAGLKKLRTPEFYGLSLALGGAEIQADQIAGMYCMMVNGGEISKINLLDSEVIKDPKALLSPESAFLTREMLKANDPPNSVVNSYASLNRTKIPWKTGTSFGFHDAWSAGILGKYALVVWVGNFDGRANPAFIGRDTAGVLFFRLVDLIHNIDRFKEENPRVLNVKKINVCALSGDLPGKHCKALKSSWFIPGKSSIKTCTVHRAIKINPETGLATCKKSVVQGVEKVFEFWSSDLSSLFAESGIHFEKPPLYQSECLGSGHHEAPLITSPQEKIVYRLENERVEIPFSAVTDADIKTLTWFVDDQLVSTIPSNQTFFWQGRSGEFLVRVVDDEGNSNSVLIKVAGKNSGNLF